MKPEIFNIVCHIMKNLSQPKMLQARKNEKTLFHPIFLFSSTDTLHQINISCYLVFHGFSIFFPFFLCHNKTNFKLVQASALLNFCAEAIKEFSMVQHARNLLKIIFRSIQRSYKRTQNFSEYHFYRKFSSTAFPIKTSC